MITAAGRKCRYGSSYNLKKESGVLLRTIVANVENPKACESRYAVHPKNSTLKSIAGMLQSAEFVFPWYHFASFFL